MLIPTDKTRNLYLLEKDQYDKLLRENITKHYKPANEHLYDDINTEAKTIAENLKIKDQMEIMAKKEAFITLKDHKENFESTLPCRLINPAKSEMGIVSKKILDKITSKVSLKTAVNQWKNSASVVEWFGGLSEKRKHTFVCFDIVEFYPLISEDLLKAALEFIKQHTTISQQDTKIIFHSRKSLLFNKDKPWIKREGNSLFDVTMGSYDRAEVCELVGIYVLNILANKYDKKNIGLYRDDGLAAFKNTSGSKADKIKKDITKIFKETGLRISI